MVFAWLGGLLTGLDVFGHKIGVNYNGDDAYKTKFGGLLTLITYVLVVIYTNTLVHDFYEHTAQVVENYSRIKVVMNELGEFSLRENSIDIIITDLVEYPASIGKWRAMYT